MYIYIICTMASSTRYQSFCAKEWATLPHLLRFGSVPALLHLLEDLTAQRGRAATGSR